MSNHPKIFSCRVTLKSIFTACLLVVHYENNSVETSQLVFLGRDIERDTPMFIWLKDGGVKQSNICRYP